MGNLGAQKEKRNDTPISAKKDIMGDKTVRVRADLHHIIKIETAKNGGNVKEVMDQALEELQAVHEYWRSMNRYSKQVLNKEKVAYYGKYSQFY